MVDTVNITAIQGATFVFTQPLGQWAELYPLATASWRAQMRFDVDDATVLYEFNTATENIYFLATPANGQITFSGNPANGDALILNDTLVIFGDDEDVAIGATLGDTLINLLAFLDSSLASGDPSLSLCTYSVSVDVLNITYKTTSLAGNEFVLSASSGSGSFSFSGPTLSGAGGMLVMTAPVSITLGFNGEYVYDVRAEWSDGTVIYLFVGTITFEEPVTRSLTIA